MIEIPYKLKKFILLKVCDKHTSKKSLNITVKSLGITGKSFSEALILESINPQYDNRLLMELHTMNNPLSYCGLVDSRISASEKDLPVFSKVHIF